MNSADTPVRDREATRDECAATEVFERLLGGTLSESEAGPLREHLNSCSRCQAALDQLSEHAALAEWRSDSGELLAAAISQPDLGPLLLGLAQTPRAPTSDLDAQREGPVANLALGPPLQSGDLGTLDSYRVLSELGRGGMGIVYRAYDPELARTVAVKVLRPEVTGERARARFVREAQAAARLQHDHVVGVHGVVNPPDAPPYLVMQYVAGRTLREEIESSGRLEPERAARIVAEAADGLSAAHRAGLVHRDMKPANIMVEAASGRARIMDFGLVRVSDEVREMTQEGTLPGTPEYMSPEQIRDPQKIDARSDLYSLGVTLYQSLTGEVPFRGTTPMVIQQVLGDEPVSPRRLSDRVPRDLETICLKAMAKEPGRRYQTADELQGDLQRWLGGETIRARPVSRVEKAWRWCRRQPVIATLAATVALLLVLVATGSFVTARHDRALRAAAEKSKSDADLSARENQDRLVRQLAGQGMRLVEQGDLVMALPWLAEALRIDDGDPERSKLHRIRLAATLRQCPKLSHAWYSESRATYMTMSRDERYLAVGHDDGTLALCELETGQRVVHKLSGGINTILFRHDGQLLVVVTSEGAWRLCDVPRGELTKYAHNDNVTDLSPDGEQILTVGHDREVRILNIDNGEVLTVFPHDHDIRVALFSPDGTQVLTFASDRAIRIWDAASGQLVAGPLEHSYDPWRTEFSSDGRYVIACQGGALVTAEVRLWDLKSQPPAPISLAHPQGLFSARLHPDGRRLLTACWDGGARVWDIQRQKLEFSPLAHNGAVSQARFSADGRQIVTCSYDRMARVWDAATGRPVSAPLPHGGLLFNCLLTPDGRRLATRGWDKVTRVWDLAAGDDSLRLEHPAAVTYVSFSPDGRRVLTACRDGKARLWDAHQGTLLPVVLEHKAGVVQAEFGPIGDRIVTASEDHTAQVWDAESGKPIGRPLAHSGPVRRAAFDASGECVVTASEDATAWVWTAQTGEPVTGPLKHDAAVNDAAFSPDGRLVVTAGKDGAARIWNAQTGQLVQALNVGAEVWRARFNRDGSRVVTACFDGTLEERSAQVWDTATGHPVGTPLNHQDGVTHAEFSRDGLRIVTASEDGTARVWNAATGQPLTSPIRALGGTHMVHAAFSSNGAYVVTASRLAAGLWDAATGEALMPPLLHGGSVNHAEVSPQCDAFATASEDGTARLFRISADERSAAQLLSLAHLLAAHRVDDTGGVIPIEGAQFGDQWPTVRAQFADLLTPTPGVLMAWRQAQAADCERNGLWNAAVAQLDPLIAKHPTASLLHRRGQALARLGRYEAAASDLEPAVELGHDRPEDYYSWALAHLAAGDSAGYRRACEAVLARHGPTASLEVGEWIAWTLCLAPDATSDPAAAVTFAKRAADNSGTADDLNTLGAALLRAGEFDEAVERLTEAIRGRAGGGLVWDWLFLAMAEQRRGNEAEARRWLELAVGEIEKRKTAEVLDSLSPGQAADPAGRWTWFMRTEVECLRRQAEELVRAGDD